MENVNGSSFDDHIGGDSKINILKGGGGNDTLDGGIGDDFMYGEAGDDSLRWSAGADFYDGGADNDTVVYASATGASVFLDGSATNSRAAAGDTLVSVENIIGSTLGADFLVGDTSVNRLSGNGGDDRLWGRSGNDVLNGGDGNDRLLGQAGDDVLIGGIGADVFVFDLAPSAGGIDRTSDFVHLSDMIEIDASRFGGGLVAGSAVQFVSGAAATSAGITGGVFLYNTGSGFLSYDADGQGTGAAVTFFRLQNLPGLNAADFSVVA